MTEISRNERELALVASGAARVAGRQFRQPVLGHRDRRGPRRPGLGRLRQRIRRFSVGLRPDVHRPRASRCGGRGAGANPSRRDVLRQQRAGHSARRRDRRCHPVRRQGALHQHRDRGRRLRHARGARVSRPRQGDEVRGRLSRHERIQPAKPGAETAGQFSAGGAGLARHSAVGVGRHADRAIQQRGTRRQPDPRASRGTRRRDRRAVPAFVEAAARVLAGVARR